jgi:hypothetical protein
MKRKYTIVIILLFCIESVVAQTKKQVIQKRNPFEMVHVDDSVRKKLYLFISETGQNTAHAGISIYHVLGEDKANKYRFSEGIYTFKLMGPHFPIYYFAYTKKDGVQIMREYTVDGLLTELIAFFKRNEATFSENQKIAYVEAIVHDLSNRQDINGDSEILKKQH